MTRVFPPWQEGKTEDKEEKMDVKEKKKPKPIVIKEALETSIQLLDLKEPSEENQKASKLMYVSKLNISIAKLLRKTWNCCSETAYNFGMF